MSSRKNSVCEIIFFFQKETVWVLLASSVFPILFKDRPLIHRSLLHSEWRKNVPDMGGHTLQSCSFYYSHRSIKIEKKISLRGKKKGECTDDERPDLYAKRHNLTYDHERNKDVQYQCYLSFP